MATPLTSSSTAVSLLEAATDRRLCALKLSEGQRELAETIEASGLTVASCGRQSGKTTLAAVTAVWNLLLSPDLDQLAGRSARYAIAIANSREQASILVGFVREFCEHSPLLRKRIEQVSSERVTFTGGRILVAAPCSDRLTRGLRASLLVMDEAAHMVSESFGPRTAERIFTALRPSLIVFGEQSKAIIASTPGSDWFQNLYAKAEAGELPNASVFRAPTARMNPAVSEAYLQGERALLGEGDFAREFEAEFGASGSGQFFDEDDLRACVGRYRTLEADAGEGWIVGIDPSFASDPAGLAVVGYAKGDRKRLQVALCERHAPRRSRSERRRAKRADEIGEAAAPFLDRVAELSREYGRAEVVSDSHMAAIVQQELRERGVEKIRIVPWSGKLLTESFRTIRAHVLAGSISFPDDRELLSELLRVRTRARIGGQSVVELPRSVQSHCDQAAAIAAAVHRLERKGSSRPARALSSFRQRERGPLGQQTPAAGARVYSSYGVGPTEQDLETVGRMLGLRR